MRRAFSIDQVTADPLRDRTTEFVERKGIGHPDSICDGVAEAVSRALSQYYLENFDRILHHNTDKVHLGAGQAEPRYGGGDVLEPIYVLVGGRATKRFDDHPIPVGELARKAARDYILDTFDELDSSMIEIEARIGESSTDLRDLFDRDSIPRANDTSFGVGHAPLSTAEHIARSLESVLKEEIPGVGEDIKVMVARTNDHLFVTTAAAIIDRYVADLSEYLEVKDRIAAVATAYCESRTELDITVTVNAADDPEAGSVYLTTTGLSAEMGDDGGVGRGNRSNGLITPHRPMSLEATAGKNPVTHVGKLYNLKASQIAHRLHDEHNATYSTVQLLSRIGDPITEPAVIDITTTLPNEEPVRDVVADELNNLPALTQELVAGRIGTF